MDVKKLTYNFDIKQLQDSIELLLQHVSLHKHHNQISLKHTELDYEKDLWYEGTGSLTYKFGENFIVDGKLVENDLKLEQHQFTVLNKQLKNTYIEHVYNCISNDFKFGRFRLMGMSHKKCMSMHTDKTKRIHIPIITNENCLMIIDNKVHHMPADGSAYLTDTTKPHTALNANHSFMRLHLLFDLL